MTTTRTTCKGTRAYLPTTKRIVVVTRATAQTVWFGSAQAVAQDPIMMLRRTRSTDSVSRAWWDANAEIL
jgi:hypothetical protein